MAANAYILINTEPPKTREVVERLNVLRGIIVREVLGPYDIVVELEADTHEDLVGVLRQQILPINGIVDTITCLWF
jgi:hypothetical protein